MMHRLEGQPRYVVVSLICCGLRQIHWDLLRDVAKVGIIVATMYEQKTIEKCHV